jgi:hypothetical protein
MHQRSRDKNAVHPARLRSRPRMLPRRTAAQCTDRIVDGILDLFVLLGSVRLVRKIVKALLLEIFTEYGTTLSLNRSHR